MHSAYYGTFQMRPCGFFRIRQTVEAALWECLHIRFSFDSIKANYIEGSTKTLQPRVIHRHGKNVFLRLAADVIRQVNMVRDEDGVSFARKAMLQCGPGLKNGVRKFRN